MCGVPAWSNNPRISMYTSCLPIGWVVSAVMAATVSADPAILRNVGSDGLSRAVVVSGQALAHTGQALPIDRHRNVVGSGLSRQLEMVMERLSHALAPHDASLDNVVRLNVYLDPATVESEVTAWLKQRFAKGPPAVTYVATPLPFPNAMVAADAIVVAPAKNRVERSGGDVAVALLPSGRALYVSGMAAREDDLAVATRETMRQLCGVLSLHDLTTSDIVHLKAFGKPVRDHQIVRDVIAEFFPNQVLPPVSFVEWSNGLPVEIEMIAFDSRDDRVPGGVRHGWQPDEKRSPVYCRFVEVSAPNRIYVAGLRSRHAVSPDAQVHDIFTQLQTIANESGSDLQHLVKATYYVADDEVSAALNRIRPDYYDAARPPAASKASVTGTGDRIRTVTIDMIAVPSVSQ